jgi:hypothetical protein
MDRGCGDANRDGGFLAGDAGRVALHFDRRDIGGGLSGTRTLARLG